MTKTDRPTVVPDANPEADYQPTPSERACIQAHRLRNPKPAPALKVTALTIDIDHPDLRVASILLYEALGTTDTSFFGGVIQQMADIASRDGTIDAAKLNFALSVVKGIEPRDQVEAMLALQMAAVHMAILTFAKRLACIETIEQQDSAERAFNKLARTFPAQMEALKRYRTGGEQRITVQHQHVNVSDGGQAVVGTVVNGGRGDY